MEFAFCSLLMSDPVQTVKYGARYASGNAKLWVIAILETGNSNQSGPALKNALAKVNGPLHDQERN